MANKTSEPIKTKKGIDDLLNYLLGWNERNYVMAKIQLNTALRISDVLPLKIKNFYYEYSDIEKKMKDNLVINEKKTGKRKSIAINSELEKIIKKYVENKDFTDESFLLQSRKGENIPISDTQAHRIYKKVAQVLKLDNFSSHSLRKTWGYFTYIETQNIALLMKVFNHASAETTLRYIGITQKSIDDMYMKIKF